MKVNNTLRTTLLAASLALMSGSALAAVTVPVYVTFTGTVTANTCSTGVAGTAGTVDLGNISTGAFTGAGTTSPAKNFSVILTGCGSQLANSLTVWVDGSNIDTGTKSFKNMTGAGNIGVQIMKAGGTALTPGSSTSTASFTGQTAGANNTLNLQARAVQIGGTTPTAGNLSVPATLKIVYP